ncbi:hypothetical protein [uncultured Prochlorococcus sp.]|uniref:hypothetical protein n=1 Tax=uncultured Prochlorococcus sp. TaxID=159733 RepID=UPI00258EC03C|nr:hypothetical protein [uncultured Prochlorococcus sp.]
MSNINTIYSSLSPWAQNLSCTAYGILKNRERQGYEFYNYYHSLLKSEFDSAELIRKNQQNSLRKVLKNASINNPYYRDIFRSFNLEHNNYYELLEKIPILTKEKIIKNKDKLISSNINKNKLINAKTSGSTGTALSFYTTKSLIAFQWAVWWRYRRRFSFLPKQWHVNFTGKPVIKIDQLNPPFWRIDYARKQVIICSSQLNNKKIKYILDFINRKKINIFTGYPSIVTQFCELIISNSLSLDFKPSLVTLGAEKCYEYQKKIIHQVTGALITDQYGISEGCANASKCQYGNYHEDSEFSYLECLDKVQNKDGSYTGKVIATSLINNSFPFIRYQTGDTATWAPNNFKCPCGRESKVLLRIEGRIEDYVLTSDGNKFMRFDYLFKETSSIKEAQIYQKEIDYITIRYIPRDDFKKDDLEKIRKLSSEYISPLLKINFEEVNEIERTKSGKFKAVISDIKK